MNWQVLLLGIFTTATGCVADTQVNEEYYDLNTTFTMMMISDTVRALYRQDDAHYRCPSKHECPNDGVLWCKREQGNWSCWSNGGLPMGREISNVNVRCNEPYAGWIYSPTCIVNYSTRFKSGAAAAEPVHSVKLPEFESQLTPDCLLMLGFLLLVLPMSVLTCVFEGAQERAKSNPEQVLSQTRQRPVQDEIADPDNINDACVICQENKRLYAAVPCGHTLCCDACRTKIAHNKCPFCRAKIEKLFRYYNS